MMFKKNPVDNHISHIPKIVTQHGTFLASKDTPVISLKPGQEKAERRGFYSVEAKPHRFTYIKDNSELISTYVDCIGSTTQPVHYKNPREPLIPAALLAHKKPKDENGQVIVEDTSIKKVKKVDDAEYQARMTEELNLNPTPISSTKPPVKKSYTAARWNSTYKSTFNRDQELREPCKDYRRLRGPPFQVEDPPQCLSEENVISMYSTEFGLLGSNPNEKLIIPEFDYNGRIKSKTQGWTRIIDDKAVVNRTLMARVGDIANFASNKPPKQEGTINEVDRIPTVKHELTKGTTRGTYHIPGYQGYLPSNTDNPRCAEIEVGDKERKRWSNIADQYHLNIPGYSAHIPENAINDKGTRQLTRMTTFGRDYGRMAGYIPPHKNIQTTVG